MAQLELNIPITFDAAAALTINENITSRVQDAESRLSEVEQTAGSITSTVSQLSGIGGENLLINSSFQVSKGKNMPERWDYYNENTIVTYYESGSVNYLNINNNNNNGRGIVQNSTDRYNNTVQDFYPNHIYCFSFYGKKNSTYGEISCFIHYLDSSGNMLSSNLENQIYQNFNLTDSWTRYCFILKTPPENILHGFNLMLEYYVSGSARSNDIDIMMPMLLDFGEATSERITLYGPFTSNKNTNYDVSKIPAWQGNSQDTSVASSQIIQTADSITTQVGNISTRLDNGGFTITGNTVINGDLIATKVFTEQQGSGSIKLENGLMTVCNNSGKEQLKLGIDGNGDVILIYYDSNGNVLWSLGANGAYNLTSTDIVAESLVLQNYTAVNDWRSGYSYSSIEDIMADNTLLHNLFTTSTSYTKCLYLYTAARSGGEIIASGRYTWANTVSKATEHDSRYHTDSNGTYASGSFYTTNNGSMLFRELIQEPNTPQGTIDYIYTKKVVYMGFRGSISETYNIKEIHYTDSSEVTYSYD